MITIPVRRVVTALFATTGLLLALHVVECWLKWVQGHWRLIGFVGTFDMNYENNIPTFFAGFLLLFAATLLAVLASRAALVVRERRYWSWLAVIFFLMALDEQASLHELWTVWIHHFREMGGVLYFAWIIPYGLGVLVVGLLYLRFVLGLPARTRALTIASGSLYLAGAIGIEMLGGWYLHRNDEEANFLYTLLVATEETLEMCGVILFIYTLLDYLRSRQAGEALALRIR